MPADLGRIVGPAESIPLAVAICGGTHVGVVYPESGLLRLLHFAFVHDLREDDFAGRRNKYVCVIPNFLDATLVALAGYFRRIYAVHSNRNTIPYNLVPDPGAGFDPDTADFRAGPGGEGFTCATFVVHAFRSAKHAILKTDNWPGGRPGDLARQRQLIQMLRDKGFTGWADRVERNELGCPRIAPEEVAGACLEDVLPATFEQCEPNGRVLLAVLEWQQARYP
jgi:hypothetical protein